MSAAHFPDKGILWRGWNDDTRAEIEQRKQPVLLFILNRNPVVWPRLKEIIEDMPANARLRELLFRSFPALLIEADFVPEALKALGVGGSYQIAVVSPYGLTPLVTVDPMRGTSAEVINEIVLILEKLVEVWR